MKGECEWPQAFVSSLLYVFPSHCPYYLLNFVCLFDTQALLPIHSWKIKNTEIHLSHKTEETENQKHTQSKHHSLCTKLTSTSTSILARNTDSLCLLEQSNARRAYAKKMHIWHTATTSTRLLSIYFIYIVVSCPLDTEGRPRSFKMVYTETYDKHKHTKFERNRIRNIPTKQFQYFFLSFFCFVF